MATQTTQVIFKIDPKFKKAAQQRAEREGSTYSAFLQSATRAYVDGVLRMGIIPANIPEFKPTKKDLVKLKKARENYKKGDYYTLDQVKHELGIRN
ncbi:MAG TPA: hypothetical protein VJJ22_03645 [Candidatus Paceibacterota bacterium]